MKLHETAQKILCGLASESDFEGLSRENLVAIKGDQSEMHYRFLASNEDLKVIKAVEQESNAVFRHVASDESVDGMGDIILVAGWATERFQKNPQLLWAHEQRGLPIGLVDKVWKGKTEGRKALLTESHLHEADMNPMAPTVQRLIEAGALPGVSVGFIPKMMVFPNSEEERKELGLGPFGVMHKQQDLLELSVVPIPANGNALQRKMLERADGVFKSMGDESDKDVLEHIRANLCMTEDECKAIRRRTILVPDLEAAVAKVMETAKEEELEPVLADGEIVIGRTLSDTTGNGIAIDFSKAASAQDDSFNRLASAIESLDESVVSLREQLTEQGTAAAVASSDDGALTEPTHTVDDFMRDIASKAADVLKGKPTE